MDDVTLCSAIFGVGVLLFRIASSLKFLQTFESKSAFNKDEWFTQYIFGFHKTRKISYTLFYGDNELPILLT